MSHIITISDLNGRFSIPRNNYTEDKLSEQIDFFEKKYLIELLGSDLYDAFISDLSSGIPQTQIYLDIFNSFSIDEDRGILSSHGIKSMLLHFIYFEIISDFSAKLTLSGVQKNNSDNSSNITDVQSGKWRHYNYGVESYRAIQKYICDNPDDYPEFNGVGKLWFSFI